MKICNKCNAKYSSESRQCPSCYEPMIFIGSFEAYAPNLAHYGGGFKESYFSDLARLEDGSFWFQSRNKLILWALNKYLPTFQEFLEIGCGTGYVLLAVRQAYPSVKLFGSEIFISGLTYAASRLPSVKLMQMDAREIPFVDEFDAIGAFDVLEHVEEDELVLHQMYMAVKPKGFILLTVPQHDWLWSAADDYAFHARRYSANDLHSKIQRAGFRIIRSTSFVSVILPAMMISRYLKKNVKVEHFDASAELKIPPLLNAIFFSLSKIELWLIELGLNFPSGGSRLVVAQKD